MASRDFYCSWPSCTGESFNGISSIHIEAKQANILPTSEVSTCYYFHQKHDIPKPPPFPRKIFNRINYYRRFKTSSTVSKETKNMWDRLFSETFEANVYIITEDESMIPAHSCVLSLASPVLENLLQKSIVKKSGIRYIKILGVPSEVVYTFTRFLYSSCYDDEEMKKWVLHLLVLSHCYSVPSLKRICVEFLELKCLTKENAVDVLQLARNCDAQRLNFICTRMVVKDFKNVSSTEGWKVMRRANPALEQELFELVVEADSRKAERLKKMEERRVYLQLYEAMEALLHICRDGCRTIGPRDQMLKRGNQIPCGFQACKGLETLVRHFAACKTRVPGGCVHCKRMWQLFELHSRMCDDETHSCKVPLCRHFKERVHLQSKKDDAKWKLLVVKVLAAKNALGPFSARRSGSLSPS